MYKICIKPSFEFIKDVTKPLICLSSDNIRSDNYVYVCYIFVYHCMMIINKKMYLNIYAYICIHFFYPLLLLVLGYASRVNI